MDVLQQLQGYAHWIARASSRETRSIPPFVLYSGTALDADWSTAIPQDGASPPIQSSLAELRRVVDSFGGIVRIAFIQELFDGLLPELHAAGFNTSTQEPLMLCSPTTLRVPPTIPNLVIEAVTSESPIEDVQLALDINEQGFDPTYTGHASIDAAEHFRQTLSSARVFIASLNGVAVAGGMYQSPHAGITRLDGIATLERYRRRGIAASLSASMTQAAFAAGARHTFLTAVSAPAERVYARIGYHRVGILVDFVDEERHLPAF